MLVPEWKASNGRRDPNPQPEAEPPGDMRARVSRGEVTVVYYTAASS